MYLRNTFFITFLATYSLLITFPSKAQSLSEELIGKWEMHQVIQSEEDVTEQHNPQKDRWIELRTDGTFITDGTPFGSNSGKFSIEKHSTLFLDSDAGSDDDSRWKLSFSKDLMIWLGVGSAWAEEFKIIHKKAPN